MSTEFFMESNFFFSLIRTISRMSEYTLANCLQNVNNFKFSVENTKIYQNFLKNSKFLKFWKIPKIIYFFNFSILQKTSQKWNIKKIKKFRKYKDFQHFLKKWKIVFQNPNFLKSFYNECKNFKGFLQILKFLENSIESENFKNL